MSTTDSGSDRFEYPAAVREWCAVEWSFVRSRAVDAESHWNDSPTGCHARTSAKTVLAVIMVGLVVVGLAYGSPNLLTLVVVAVLLAVWVLLLWVLHRIWIGVGAPY